MSSGETAIELADVRFAYPSHPEIPILEDISLQVRKDDFLGIIGPNGGGKTTLLKVILGLLQPRAGEVRVFGRPPREVSHRIGYVPQHGRIDPSVPASVLDVVLTGRLHKSSWGAWWSRKDREAAFAALEQTQTAQFAHHSIAALSGGQRQRVLIARALAAEAELLLLDEPTAGVDAPSEQNFTDLLHELNRRVPIVLVSHDVSFVCTHLKRVACLNRRLTVHLASEVSPQVIAQTYGEPVCTIQHRRECPLADRGCDEGCPSVWRQAPSGR